MAAGRLAKEKHVQTSQDVFDRSYLVPNERYNVLRGTYTRL